MASDSAVKIEVIEGFVDFPVPEAGKECRTWYTIFDPVSADCAPGATATKKRPLVCVHGGPGIPHVYFEPIKALAEHTGKPVIMYDQLGCGKSTRLPEKVGEAGTAFWTPALFLAELDNLLSGLGIKDDYDLLGHSWGGMLSSLHAVGQPAGLKRLILADAPASVSSFMDATSKLRKTLPQELQDILDKGEAEKNYEDPEFKGAVMAFYMQFVCRCPEPPALLLEAMEELEKDNTVYMSMNGPSEFIITGTIKTFDVSDKADKINVPTLLLNGRYDEVADSCVEPLFSKIDKVKWVTFAESSHMAWFEEPERFFKVVSDFLVSA